ncbi:MAG: hypothetical protein CML04_09690 [Pseudozobellia sp.]|nr:hypothetical protein [Pseudozobellia sp.]MBG50750.1 hypothetical protein [Pseudozobellia sp.]
MNTAKGSFTYAKGIMETIFKSDVFKNRIYRLKYRKDFLSDELIENTVTVDTPDVSGIIRELNLNGIFVFSKHMSSANGYSFDVSNNFSVFKLHFEISGNYSYFPEGHREPFVQIPNYHYNMFYLPHIKGRLDYQGSPRRTFEVIFTLDFVKRIAGNDYKQFLQRVNIAVEKGRPYIFWEEARPISPEIGKVLEDIISCPYKGEIKRNYLQSKITTLLIDLLIEANGKYQPEPKVVLPAADLESLGRVERYIKSNLKKTIRIAKLAEVAGFNSSKLKRDFKMVYGTTLFKYITRLRMERAKMKIRKEGLSVAQAAYEVGYTNPQHFTSAFKRTLGYLPSNLKKSGKSFN